MFRKDQYIDEQRRMRNLRAHGMTHGLRRWNPYGTSSRSSGGRWGASSYMRNPRPAAQMPRFAPPVAADSWPAAYAPPMRRYNPEKYFNPFLRNRNPEKPFNPFLRRNPESYRRNPDIEIIFRMNLKTGKKDIIIDVHSDEDTLAHEHERDHRKIVEQLIGQGIISAAEVGEVTIKRGGKVPAPLKGKKKEEPPEKKAISTRKAKKAKRKYNRKKK